MRQRLSKSVHSANFQAISVFNAADARLMARKHARLPRPVSSQDGSLRVAAVCPVSDALQLPTESIDDRQLTLHTSFRVHHHVQ